MNPYDKFDAPEKVAGKGANPYDQFDGPARPQPDLVSQIPGTPAPPQAPTPEPSAFSRFVSGPAEAAASVGTGMIAAPIGAAAGMGRALTSGKIGTPAGVRAGEETAGKVSRALTYEPRGEAGRGQLESLGQAFESSKLGGMNPSQAMAMGSIPRPPAGAMGRAVGTAGRAIAESPEGQAVKRGVQKVGAAMRPEIDPQVAELARKAEGMGIKVTPDMLSDNKFLRLLGQASREVPLSGSPVAGNREAFNRMVIKAFGGDENATKISPAVFERAMNKHGSTIGDISAKNPIPFDEQFVGRLNEMATNAANFETSDVAKVIKSYTDEIVGLGQAKGVIDGEAFRKIRTKLTSQMRRTNNGDLKHALSQLDDHMLDAIQGQLSPQELEAFNQARIYYSNGKTVEPLIAKAASKGFGDMSPAALAGRLTATGSGKSNVARGRGGELADVSAVGNRFTTEPGSSNTAERGLAYGLLGGSGFAGGPLGAAGIYGAANLYNRLGPRIARGMIPRPPGE